MKCESSLLVDGRETLSAVFEGLEAMIILVWGSVDSAKTNADIIDNRSPVFPLG